MRNILFSISFYYERHPTSISDKPIFFQSPKRHM